LRKQGEQPRIKALYIYHEIIMRLQIFIILLLGFSSHAFAQNAVSDSQSKSKARYITDELFVFMHAGPGRNYRIVGSIESGAAVLLLQTNAEAEFTEIKDDGDRVGWVESKYLSNNPSIRLSLQTVESELNALQQEASELRNKMSTVQSKYKETDIQNNSLSQTLAQTLEQKEKLERQLAEQDQTNQIQWLTRGAILALISIVMGYLIGLFARKRNRSNRIM
jgi:SH3 domain protein